MLVRNNVCGFKEASILCPVSRNYYTYICLKMLGAFDFLLQNYSRYLSIFHIAYQADRQIYYF